MIDDMYNVGNDYPSVSAIAKYDIAKDLLTELICLDMEPVAIDISFPECDGYDREYLITIDEEGVWCQKIYGNGRYTQIEDDVVYIHEDCNSLLLKNIFTDSDRVFEFSIGEEE